MIIQEVIMNEKRQKETNTGSVEKSAPRLPGMPVLVLNTLLEIAAVALLIATGAGAWEETGWLLGVAYSCVIGPVVYMGLKIVAPQEALALTLFGKYYGTLFGAGFFWVNPFVVSVNSADGAVSSGAIGKNSQKKVSLKVMTLNNDQQKINDQLGNPIIIGIAVIWRVVDTAKAVFDVDNYQEFLSSQCDSALRDIVRLYPYDNACASADGGDSGGDEQTLRGSSAEIALKLTEEIQRKVGVAGLEILEARITHLSYAPEIAAAMLQRQQAAAVIAARQMIVDGAVSMVEMALNKLNDKNIVRLDEERKAAMVSNLLVVLCSNKDTQPVVNSGSIY
jgi:regulator of protease activity HflC (stomatin/prohibitin superfamily)